MGPGSGVTGRSGGSSPGVPGNPTTSVDTPRTTWLPTSAPREAGTISPLALIPRSTLDLFVNMKIKHCNCKKKTQVVMVAVTRMNFLLAIKM